MEYFNKILTFLKIKGSFTKNHHLFIILQFISKLKSHIKETNESKQKMKILVNKTSIPFCKSSFS